MEIEFNESLAFLFEPARLKIIYGNDMLKSGIYKILNKLTGKIYLGSAFDFNRRFTRHKRLLNYNKHPNKLLQASWNLHGEEAFEFIIIEYWSKITLIEREQFWLDWYKSYNKDIGYNICKIADNRTGILHSEEAKKKMSIAQIGKIVTQETRDKIGLKHKGKIVSELTRQLLSEKNKGWMVSNEVKLNMAKGQIGRKHSEESKLKRSVLLKGKPFNNPKKNPKHSEETKRKQSEARIRYLNNLKEAQTNV
jgi:group I intron endonuclease